MATLPQIEEYRQRVSPQVGVGPLPQRSAISNASGLASIAGGIEAIQHQEAATYTAKTLSQVQTDWQQSLRDRMDSAGPGAPNFTPTLLKDYDEYSAKTLAQAPAGAARQFMTERLAAYRTEIAGQAIHFEANERAANNLSVAKDSIDAARNEVQVRPEAFGPRLAERRAIIEQMGLPPKQKEAVLEYASKSLSSDAVTGLINKNPYLALKALNSAPGESGVLPVEALHADDRLRLRTEAEVEIRRREAEGRERLASARQELGDRVNDARAAYLSGMDVPDPPSRADFQAVYPVKDQKEANRHYDSFAQIQQLGGDLRAATRMPPAEQNALIEQRRPTQVEGAAAAVEAHTVLVQHIKGLQAELAKDPAAYVETYTPAVKTASDAFAQSPSPETAQSYAQASVSAQHAMGVLAPRLLTQPQVHAMSERLKLTGNGQDVVGAIAQERQTWGRYWPQVLSEGGNKLNPAVQVIALGMDPVPAARLASVAALKPEDRAKILPSNVKETDVKMAVQDQLQDFSATMIGLAGAEDQLARLHDSAVQLASSYVAGGEKVSKAAERAANEVVLSRYSVESWRGNALRLPKSIDADLVIHGLASEDSTIRRELKVDSSAARWRTLPDDSGLVLEDAATNRPLLRADGSLAAYSFGQLAQRGVNRNEDVRKLKQSLQSAGEPQ